MNGCEQGTYDATSVGAGRSGDGCASTCKVEFERWTRIARAHPGSTRGESATYDPVRRQVLLFDGYQVWAWNGTVWAAQPSTNTPPFRRFFSLAFDHRRRRLVMFGGGEPAAPASAQLGDTWEWDGFDWHDVTPAAGPAPRSGGSLSYDATRGVVLLFGGNHATNPLTDTWEWDGVRWAERTGTVMPTVAGGIAPRTTFDTRRGRVVLYTNRGLWAWTGADWEHLSTPPTEAQRNYAAFGYDPDGDRFLLFGGNASGQNGDELWAYQGATWTQVTPVSPPPAMHSAALVYDELRARMVLYGNDSNSQAATWELSGATFTPLLRSVGPAGRYGHRMAYDLDRQRTVLYGGTDAAGATLQDTWEWDGAAWRDVSPAETTLPPAAGHAMAYDRSRRETVLFGDGETWVWNGTVWTQRAPASTPVVFGPLLAYDAARARIVLFGHGAPGTASRTWEWDGNDWEERQPAQAPIGRTAAAMSYDELRARVVLFGGRLNAGGRLGDVWEWDGTTWSQQQGATPAPVARQGHAMAFHAGLGVVVLSGGTAPFVSDTWSWDGAWSLRLPTNSPDPLIESAMAPDARGAIVTFGGYVDTGGAATVVEDTWIYSAVAPQAQPEACLDATADRDGDGRAGCDDPDCWYRCIPTCPPHTTCPTGAPACGDLACQREFEDHSICPADCP